ncbi:MAG: extensin, partial [Rubrivivax sp.]
AEALDVTGFMLHGGRRIGVQRDWADAGPDGAFLREVHDGACRWFDGVLGPDYNAAHRDHFHLESGGWRTCR